MPPLLQALHVVKQSISVPLHVSCCRLIPLLLHSASACSTTSIAFTTAISSTFAFSSSAFNTAFFMILFRCFSLISVVSLTISVVHRSCTSKNQSCNRKGLRGRRGVGEEEEEEEEEEISTVCTESYKVWRERLSYCEIRTGIKFMSQQSQLGCCIWKRRKEEETCNLQAEESDWDLLLCQRL